MIYNSHAKHIPYLDRINRDFSSNEEWYKVAKKMLMPRDGQDRPIAPVEDAKVCVHMQLPLCVDVTMSSAVYACYMWVRECKWHLI